MPVEKVPMESVTIPVTRPVDTQQVRDRWFVAIMVATFMFAIGPPAIQSLTAPKYRTNILQESVPASPLTAHFATLSSLLVLAICIVSVVMAGHEIPHTGHLQLGVLLLPWVCVMTRDEYLHQSFHRNMLIYPVVCIATWLLRPRLQTLEVLGYLVGATALLSLAMGQFLPAKGLYQSALGTEISPDKKIFSSGLLVGPLPNGNNLGQFLVMGLATILLVRRRSWRIGLVGACLFALVWTAARSSLTAAAVLLLLALALKVLPLRARPGVVVAVLAPMTITVAALPLLTNDPKAFSNRGFVWQVSKEAAAAHPWVGLGSNYYSRVAATSSNLGGSVFHGHNQFMQALVTGGYVLALAMGLVVAVAIGTAARLAKRSHVVPALYLAGFIGACMLEVSYSLVDRLFTLPVVAIPLACILLTVDRDQPLQPAEPRPERIAVQAGARPRNS